MFFPGQKQVLRERQCVLRGLLAGGQSTQQAFDGERSELRDLGGVGHGQAPQCEWTGRVPCQGSSPRRSWRELRAFGTSQEGEEA